MSDSAVKAQERELKFEVEGSVPLPDLGPAVPAEGHITRYEPVILQAVYFDTDDRRLARSGIILRRRVGGRDAGWHLKLPDDGPNVRTEIRLPLSTREDTVPSELEQFVSEQVSHRRLRPVLRLRTERTVTEFVNAENEQVVELDDDYVLAVRLADLDTTSWHEVEIEERASFQATVDRLEGLLFAHGFHRASYGSKMERGLDANGSRQLPSTERLDPLVARLRTQLAELIEYEFAAREGEDDAVHRMRVATRRLRSCLETFHAAFLSEPRDHLTRELRWLGAHLGAVRDAEVIAARIVRDLNELAPEDLFGPVRATLSARGSTERAETDRALIDAINSSRYRALLEELARFASQPPFAASKRSRKSLRRRCSKSVRRTEQRVALLKGLQGADRDAALHEVRKAAKHMRYAAETLVPMFGGVAKGIAENAEFVQEVLGEHHDAIVTRRVLRDEGARAGVRPGENGFSYGVLFAREDARASAAEAAFWATWKNPRRPGALS